MQGESAPRSRGDAIAVDQVGYLPDAEKRAVVVLDGRSFTAPAAGTDRIAEGHHCSTFAVVDAEDGEVVFRDELGPPVEAPTAGRTVRHADFSAVTTSGTYAVRLEGDTVRSHPFRIGADVYDSVLRDVGRLYALKRSNQWIDDPLSGLDLDPGHPQDTQATLADDGPDREAGETIDVAGGWYDAGDYGKYVPPAAVTVAYHLIAYDLAPSAFDPGQYELPDGFQTDQREGADADDALPDLLAEAKFELEWLEKMQRPDGGVYHKIAGSEWTPWGKTPAEDDMERFVFGHSTFGTGMYAGAMAMAARVFDPFDSGFAERALDNAVAAFDYLDANPEPAFQYDEGQDAGSGPYDKDSDAEERFWAGAELLRTTGEVRFAEYLHDECAAQFDESVVAPSWSDGGAFGQWAYRNADENVTDADRRETLDTAFVTAGESLVDRIERDGYRIGLRAEDFHWASAKVAVANGVLLVLANDVEPREAFRDAALDPLHYVLGRSPTGYSYVTGHGHDPVSHPHDRLVASSGKPLAGMLVGGPNAQGDDPVMADFLERESPPPALAYLDASPSFSVNEWAIDYSAPLVALLGHAVASA